jgi:hypothetical protein
VRLPLALVTFLLTLLSVSPCLAATKVVLPDGSAAQPYQAWVDSAQVPTPNGTVVVHLESCPGGPEWAGACALPDQRAIYLGGEGRNKARFLHELGHIFDRTNMTDPLRRAFQSITRKRGLWAAAASTDPPLEQFAEAFSTCARHRTLRATAFGMYAYTATPALHRRACSVIRQAAAA